jgi:hypothetical protein
METIETHRMTAGVATVMAGVMAAAPEGWIFRRASPGGGWGEVGGPGGLPPPQPPAGPPAGPPKFPIFCIHPTFRIPNFGFDSLTYKNQ